MCVERRGEDGRDMSDDEEDLQRALALSVATPSAARPRRAAAQQAQQRVEELAQKPASLGEGSQASDSEEGEEEEEPEAPEPEPPNAPLSDYELQRQQNIAANQQKLAMLGLLQQGQPAPKRARAAPVTSRGRATDTRRQQPKRARATAAAAAAQSRGSPPGAAAHAAGAAATAVLQETPPDSEDDEYVNEVAEVDDDDDDDDADSSGDDDASDLGSTPTTTARVRGRSAHHADTEIDDSVRLKLALIFRTIRNGEAGAPPAALGAPPACRVISLVPPQPAHSPRLQAMGLPRRMGSFPGRASCCGRMRSRACSPSCSWTLPTLTARGWSKCSTKATRARSRLTSFAGWRSRFSCRPSSQACSGKAVVRARAGRAERKGGGGARPEFTVGCARMMRRHRRCERGFL